MRATVLNCTLKKSPEKSNCEALAQVVIDALANYDVEAEVIRLVDLKIPFGVESDMGDGDEWPGVREKILASEILILAVPTWIGQPSAVAKLALERMDAFISETDDEERPVAYNRVAGVINTGNEDGAHHVIMQVNGALGDIGYTIAPQSFTYWNMGPGPGPDYLETDHGHEFSESTGKAMAQNLVAVAKALAANPIPAPPSGD